MPETQKGINTDSYANMPYSPSKSKEKTGNYKVGKGQKSCEYRTSKKCFKKASVGSAKTDSTKAGYFQLVVAFKN